MNEIAVIVPVYNTEKYLDWCLNSLMNQKIEASYHVYIIDDGSTDSSANIAQRYANEFPDKFSYIYQKNGGLSAARNTGIVKSESKFIAFVDSDDYVDEDYLGGLYNLCIQEKAEISMCGIMRVSGNKKEGKRFDSGYKEDFVSNNIERILETSSFAAWNKMYSREIIGEIRFPYGMTYEDFATVPQIMNRAKNIAYTNQMLYFYRANPDSIILSAQRQKNVNRDILKAQHVLEKSELKKRVYVLETLYIRRVLSSLAWTTLEYGKTKKDDVLSLVNEAYEHYPNIQKNSIIKELPFVKRVFVKLLLKKKIWLAGKWVVMYSSFRRAYHKIRIRPCTRRTS